VEKILDKIPQAFELALQTIFDETRLPLNGLSTYTKPLPVFQLLASIGITGDLKGNLVIAAQAHVARSLAAQLCYTNGITLDSAGDEELAQAAFAEFSNQIAGRAIMNLSPWNLDCNLTPPTIISGVNVSPDFSKQDKELVFQADWTGGQVYLIVAVSAKKSL